MQKRSKFIKGVKPKYSKNTKDLNKIYSIQVQDDKKIQFSIKKQQLKDFQFIGIYDKKVILTYNNELQGFGYFDLHAMHERIRYEHFSLQLKIEALHSNLNSPFDIQCIQKTGEAPPNIFGKNQRLLLKMPSSNQHFINLSKTVKWGISFQANQSNEIYITSACNLLGKQWSHSQLENIFKDIIFDQKRVPKIIDEWIGEYSCKSAWKFNQNINATQAKLLMQNLSKCDFPWFCVHGRPTMHFKAF